MTVMIPGLNIIPSFGTSKVWRQGESEPEVDTPPSFTTSNVQTAPENQTSVTTLNASGTTPITYTIVGGTDQAAFDITGSVLSFVSPPDFETKTSYSVTVRATNDFGTDDLPMTVNVTNVNEAVTLTSSDTFQIDENTTTVGTVTSSDIDASDTATYSITGGSDASFFSINPTTGVLSFNSPPDYETPLDANPNNVYRVEVTVTDSGNLTDSELLFVQVQDVNDEIPVITSPSSFSVDEGTTSVGTVTATDADANTTITFSITGGADAGSFSIGSSTGVLTLNSAPDYESKTSYQVQVTASDGTNSSAQMITVNINDLNDESPVITSPNSFSVPENQTSVGTVTATDADAGDSVTYSITGGADQSAFSIGSSSGVLTFNSPPDRETKSSYTVQVTATDTNSNTSNQTITVTVTDVNDSPPVFTSPSSFTIDENTTAVGTVTTSDPDVGGSRTYSIVGGDDSSLFSIDSLTGALTFDSAPDYELPGDANGDNDYLVTVRASDGVNTADQNITVTVEDVSEGGGGTEIYDDFESVPNNTKLAGTTPSTTIGGASWFELAGTNTGVINGGDLRTFGNTDVVAIDPGSPDVDFEFTVGNDTRPSQAYLNMDNSGNGWKLYFFQGGGNSFLVRRLDGWGETNLGSFSGISITANTTKIKFRVQGDNIQLFRDNVLLDTFTRTNREYKTNTIVGFGSTQGANSFDICRDVRITVL